MVTDRGLVSAFGPDIVTQHSNFAAQKGSEAKDKKTISSSAEEPHLEAVRLTCALDRVTRDAIF